MNRIVLAVGVALTLHASAQSPPVLPVGAAVPVTVDNFVRAESDLDIENIK